MNSPGGRLERRFFRILEHAPVARSHRFMNEKNIAFGAPGDPAHWAHADKDGVGTAFGQASRVWFTMWRGILTEVCYPTVDRPQLRDLRLFIAGGNFLHEEAKDLDCRVERIGASQGYRIRRQAPGGAYELEKEIICDPDQPCVLMHVAFSGALAGLRCYAVCNPHLEVGGSGNNAQVRSHGDRAVLVANRNDRWLAIASQPDFECLSCGYIGQSDGATDLRLHRRLAWQFDKAENGNVSLSGEVDIEQHPQFTLALAFGESRNGALTAALHALSVPYEQTRERFVAGWEGASKLYAEVPAVTGDRGALFRASCNVLVTHKDKIYLGGIIGALATPFGEARTDEDGKGGYHLVWPRDVVNSATALLALGDRKTPLQTLIYLAVAQRDDGSFAQNFWIDGKPCWSSLQLDEVTYPILLAYRLRQQRALGNFRPLSMIMKAAEYIVHQGPVTPQERWEQLSGYSPSTFAVVIAALICAASFARDAGSDNAADFLTDYADYLYDHMERWMVTDRGGLHPEIHRYFVRIHPAKPGEAPPPAPDDALVKLSNQPPGMADEFPARNITDAGFLHLVRYGILKHDDPLIVDSLRVVDRSLRVETPFGPCWRRYNHDGYGQRDDGRPYDKWGKGRAWPLLTGERGHYELAAGRDASPYLRTIEKLATPTKLLAEQVWDEPKKLNGCELFGKPTGSAVPLVWAHAEYIKLALSIQAGRVLDRIPEVADRYLNGRQPKRLAMWTFHHPIHAAIAGADLRIYARKPFRLRFSLDNWETVRDEDAKSTGLEVHFVDVKTERSQCAPVRFTFYWLESQSWHGCNYSVALEAPRS
jgi:glucoamylase